MPHYALLNTPVPTQAEQQAGVVSLAINGPRLLVELSLPDALVSNLTAAQKPVPGPTFGAGLIDTGASNTSIDEDVAVALGLQVVNTLSCATPNGVATKNVYAVKLSFPGTMLPPIPFFEAAGLTLANQGLHALIGRDFLVGKVLHYDGNISIVSISW